MARPRKTIARKYLEQLVADETAPAPERTKAAIVLLRAETDAKRQPGSNWPKTWDEAE